MLYFNVCILYLCTLANIVDAVILNVLYIYKLHRWWPKNCPPKTDDDSESSMVTGFDNFAGIFLILAGGVILSITVSVCQYIYRRLNCSREKKQVPIVKNCLKN